MPDSRLTPLTEALQPPARMPREFALFTLGFRPFYLLAALFAAVSMAGWMGFLEGLGWHGYLPAPVWHQHEMVFGFALATLTGFLLTAGRAWTGLPTPQGWPLALLATHWVAARVLLFTGPDYAAAVFDGSFPFVFAAVMARVLIAAGNRRYYFAVAVLSLLGLANIGFYLEQAGLDAWPTGVSVHAALFLVVTMVVIIGGRVVPSFTANALPRAGVIVRSPRLDYAALGFTLAAFAAALTGPPAWFTAPIAGIAALLHLARQARWAPLATLRRPILWILHLSHAWIPAGLVLLALSSLGWIAPSVALHAFGAGVVGGMIIGMITRTALGHTGRPLHAGWQETSAYVLVHAAAATRVAAGLAPDAYTELVWAAGHLWALAFLVYFFTYLPRLALAERLKPAPVAPHPDRQGAPRNARQAGENGNTGLQR